MTSSKNEEQATTQVAKGNCLHGKTTKKAFAVSQLEGIINSASELKTSISEATPLLKFPEVHFFQKKSELTEFAETLQGDKYRTTFNCSCEYNNRRGGILVVDKNNQVTYELIRCNNCVKKFAETEQTEQTERIAK